MNLNTDTDMLKSLSAVIALAAILSLSVFVNAAAVGDTSVPENARNSDAGTVRFGKPPKTNTHDSDTTDNDNNGNHDVKHKADKINSLFRGHLRNEAPVATLLPQTQGFNATFYDANMPYCWYVVNAPPCYDINTESVIR
jgi:phosphoglycerol transferase MdoB-like AlkP superfamily enzyme